MKCDMDSDFLLDKTKIEAFEICILRRMEISWTEKIPAADV